MAVILERLCAAGHDVFCAQRQESGAAQRRLADLGVQYIWLERDPDDDFSAFANDHRTEEDIFSRLQPDFICS